jgi:hypothetical protein
MKSQTTATATIENALSCSGDTALVAVDVTDFIDVAAMTLYIGYDTNAAEFLSLQNVHPAVTGFLTTNATDGQIGIAYSNINPFSITSGKLFDLKIVFSGDSTALTFNPGTEIANSNLEVIPLLTFAGSISNGLVITSQPDSVQAYPDNDVIFTVGVSGSMTFQWQENTGSGWVSLQNNSTYNGVDNDTLTISDVPISYNGYLYRCALTSGNCSDTSEAGLLEVALAYPTATLGTVVSCPESIVFEPLFGGDILDMIEFTFNISFDTSNLEFQGLENIHPLLENDPVSVTPIASPPGISIQWTGSEPVSIGSGKFFDLTFIYTSQDNLLVFAEGTEVINSLFNPINITLTNGHINQQVLPQITQHPQYIAVTEGDDAQFNVIALGTSSYQWQVSLDGGNNWTSLTNTIPYYNTNTQELTIDPVSLDMDDNLYACVVGNEFCSITSNDAKLDVDSLTGVTEITAMNSGLTIHPNPFAGHIELSNIGSPEELTINIYSASGQLVYSSEPKGSSKGPVRIDLPDLKAGLYLLSVTTKMENKTIIQTRKIIKTN